MDDNLDPLDRFGQFLMRHLRDRAISYYDGLAQHRWTASALRRLQDDLATLDEQQRAIVRRCVIQAVDGALHDFLFRLQVEDDNGADIQVLVGGTNIVQISAGLHADLFGWMAEYSAYGASPPVP